MSRSAKDKKEPRGETVGQSAALRRAARDLIEAGRRGRAAGFRPLSMARIQDEIRKVRAALRRAR